MEQGFCYLEDHVVQQDVRTKVLDTITSVYNEIFGKQLESFEFDLPVNEIGLDSLDIIDFVYQIEDALNLRLKFDDSSLAKITITQLTDSIVASMEKNTSLL